MSTQLGDFLRKSRTNLSLSLRAAEGKTGVSNAYISQLETGQIQEPSPLKLEKMADGYGVSYQTLMRLAGYRVPDDTTEVKSLQARNTDLNARIKKAASVLGREADG